MTIQKRALAIAAAALVATGSALAEGGAAGQANDRKPAAVRNAAHEISAADLKARLDRGEKVFILDARSSLDGRIVKGAVHVPVSGLAEWAKDKDRKALVVTYCTCPRDEAAIVEVNELRAMGFERAYALAGGMHAASEAGIEVVAPAE